jgi:hypothetical protein
MNNRCARKVNLLKILIFDFLFLKKEDFILYS